MNGIDFGVELKKIRTNAGVSSKSLSTKVGKAVTYVSQLENGKIKSPDYSTSYLLLKELGIEESKIEGFLDHFGFISPEREQANLSRDFRIIKEEEEKWNKGWYTKRYEDVSYKRDLFNITLSDLIQFDLTRAEVVIGNMDKLTKNEEDFDFFCSLFENNLSSLNSTRKKELLRWVEDYVKDRNNEDFNSDTDHDIEAKAQ